MLPTKRRNESNLIVCGTSEKKVPKPPDPRNNPLSPSLLKALEAVVEAGRRGLLGPTARAAVTPESNLKGSNGVDCQDALKPFPVVKRGKNIKKTNNITVVEQVRGERHLICDFEGCGWSFTSMSKLIRHKRKHKDDRRVACSVEVCEKSFTKAEHLKGHRITHLGTKPFECPVEGVKSLQPSPKEVWICGNYVIMASERRARNRPHGLQLGFPSSKACVYWHGIQAMMWDQLVPLLHEIYQIRSSPSIIIVHVGENDLLPNNSTSLIIKMKNDLGVLRRAFPNTVIIWSSLLPRRVWEEGQNPELMRQAVKDVNLEMEAYCNETGIHFLTHNVFTTDRRSLFFPEDNDLSNVGTDTFTADLKEILQFFLGVNAS